MPMSARAISQRLIRPRMLSTSSSERRDLDRVAPFADAGTSAPADVCPGGARILVERLVDLAACGLTSRRRHRDLRGRVGRGDHLAVGEDDLGDDGDATERFARQAEDSRAGRTAETKCGASLRASRSVSSTWLRSSFRTSPYVIAEAPTTATATAAAEASVSRVRKLMFRGGRSRRRESSGSAGACRPPPSSGGGSRCRRRASSSRSRSRSPRRARRSPTASAPAAG